MCERLPAVSHHRCRSH